MKTHPRRKKIWLILPGFLRKLTVSGLILGSFFLTARPSRADTRCSMDFTLKSWSVFYKSGKGSGTVSCDNGQKTSVTLRTKGGGITFGKSHITGRGEFSPVPNMRDLFGSYSAAEGHAGVVKSASGRALSKGDINLTLTGSGSGADIGFDFGSFKIHPISPGKSG